MVGLIIQLIIALLILGIIWWAIEQLLPLIPLPAAIAQVVRVLLILLLALIILFYFLIPLLHQLGHLVPG